MTIEIMDTSWAGDQLILHVLEADASYTVTAEFVWDSWNHSYDVVLSPPQHEHGEELAEHAYEVRDRWLKNRV
jgi:hypothetical protein